MIMMKILITYLTMSCFCSSPRWSLIQPTLVIMKTTARKVCSMYMCILHYYPLYCCAKGSNFLQDLNLSAKTCGKFGDDWSNCHCFLYYQVSLLSSLDSTMQLLGLYSQHPIFSNLPMGPISQSVTLHSAEKACQGQKLQLIGPFWQLRRK